MPIYPGDVSTQLKKINNLANDGFNNFLLTTGMHAGTHIDGPMHLTQSKKFISEIPLEQLIGTGCVLNVVGENSIEYKPEYESQINQESIVLVRTGFDTRFEQEEYYNNYPTVSLQLAQFFIQKHIKMLGMDTPSPDRPPHEIHKLLLENNVLIAENLKNLDQLLTIKMFDVIALPLRIYADSSPARIVAKIFE